MPCLARWIMAGLFAILSATVAAAGPSYASLVDKLDIKKSTKLQLAETWKGYKGQEVSWTATVVEVKDGKRTAKVYLVDHARRSFKGYNIILATNDIGAAAKLRRGQKIRFQGMLYDYDHHNNGSITIDLREGRIL